MIKREDTNMYDAIALGELLIDFTYSGMSKDGQKLFEQNPGGAPANMLAVLNNCGKKTAFIGKVGDDMHGEFMKTTLENAGIDTAGVITNPNVFTTLAFVDINEAGERNFSFARKPGADTMLTEEEVSTDLLKQCKIFHFGSLSLTSEPSKSATWYAIQKAKEYGCIVTYDPNYRASLWNSKEEAISEMKSVISCANIMKISDEETELLTGESNIENAAQKILEQGVLLVVVTLGKDGAYVCNHEGGMYVKGYKSNAVDTTGAGDSFFGGFLTKFLESEKKVEDISVAEAADFALFGNAVASLCVEKRGGIPAIPTYEEAVKRCEDMFI